MKSFEPELTTCDTLLQIVQQLQTLVGLLKAPKQDLEMHNAPSAAPDALQSKASGEEVDANAARKPRGFGGGLGALRATRLSAKSSERQTVGERPTRACIRCATDDD